MEAAIGAASGLIDGVVKLLSNELMQTYVASAELGLNAEKIKTSLFFAQDLLQQARQRGMAEDRPGLKGLMQQLSAKADQAEDALDELHYFIIQDQLDGTKYAVPDLGQARHGRHALRHTVGNCLACFSCSPTPQDHGDGDATVDTNNLHNATKSASASGVNDGPADNLSFDRVAMSKKIKLVIEQILPLCDRVSELLKINPPHANNTPIVSRKRPIIGSTSTQDTLYGRSDLLEKTIEYIITSAAHSGEKLFVLPIVGPGGIGKTTFTQHLYNDKGIEEQPAAGCFPLETLEVDCISGMLAAPVCSLFATTLHKLYLSCDQRVESFTEEEENALQLLASLRTLFFWRCPGLPSLPQGLHTLSSLTELHVAGCPEIRSLPKEGLPTSLRELDVYGCSPELKEEARKWKETNSGLRV